MNSGAFLKQRLVSFPMQGKGEIWANPCPLDIVSPEFVRNAFGLAIRILESGSLSFFDNYEALDEKKTLDEKKAFVVEVQEVQPVRIMAKDIHEARSLVADGNGDSIDHLIYSHILFENINDWEVYEDDEECDDECDEDDYERYDEEYDEDDYERYDEEYDYDE